MGIDPGRDGAIAIISNDPPTRLWWLLKELEEDRTVNFEDLIRDHGVQRVYIEKAQTMNKGEAAKSMFNYGVGFGKLIGWCEMLRVPFVLVPPYTWTSVMHKGCTAGADPKVKSAEACRRLFPDEKLIAEGCRTPHKGVIDALLITEYGRMDFRS